MARGVTLTQCVDDLRAAIRAAASPAQGQGARPGLIAILQRVQRTLWTDHAWPFLMVKRDKVLSAGSRYYSFPADLDFDRITGAEVKHNGQWLPVKYGVTNAHYNQLDPEDSTARTDPVQCWQWYEGNQFEIWPLPASNGAAAGNGRVRFEGIKNLSAFLADADVTTLDADLIVLFAAAEIMAGNGQKDAPAKLNAARGLLIKLLGNTSKSEPFIMGGGLCDAEQDPNDRVQVLYVRAG